jgi:4-hydroxybenzoate polyprenyltransferase
LGAARGGTLRAWAELLRAPLLLSPAADVLAGWSVAAAALAATDSLVYCAGPERFAGVLREALLPLGVAAATGVLLLAGGMALNGVVDLSEDRQRKPDRPLPRGAVSLRAATAAALGCLVLAVLVAWRCLPAALAAVATMAGLIVAYHGGLKRLRLPGCAVLGAIRGLDLWLGVVALRSVSDAHAADIGLLNGSPPPGDVVFPTAVAYAAYMAAASLFASTDDEQGGVTWARTGLVLAIASLVFPLLRLRTYPHGLAGRAAVMAAWIAATAAIWRIVLAARGRPRPVTTGVLLSGLYLFHVVACFTTGWGAVSLMAGMACLLLFAASRLLLRSFPPT